MLPLFILHVVIYQVVIVRSFGQVTKVFDHLFSVILTTSHLHNPQNDRKLVKEKLKAAKSERKSSQKIRPQK